MKIVTNGTEFVCLRSIKNASVGGLPLALLFIVVVVLAPVEVVVVIVVFVVVVVEVEVIFLGGRNKP